ncbi:MAG: flagellar hook-associated protein FlgL [Nitrospinota bacterium]|nr:flagellar hook-associated protein FlgL [Nitrospinota bacterium]
MVTRVTNQAQQANSLQNIFRITEKLFKAQQEIATGKRINRPSDDPTGIRDSLLLRTNLNQSNQYIKNIVNNRIFIEASDTSLNSINLSLIRAKELSVGELGGVASAETRNFAALEIDQLISQVFDSANTKVKNRFIFSGTNFRVKPFSSEASGAVYTGNSEAFKVGVANNVSIDFAIPGCKALATDLNPQITSNTNLSSLNGGIGITEGTFSISDRAGNTANINVSSTDNIGRLISKINNASVNVTASITSNGRGLQLTDTNNVVSKALTISEVSGGTTAAELGILGKKNGTLTGFDLNATLTASTLIPDLECGNGIILNDVKIVNGAASATVTLSSANTIGDILDTINGAGLNVTASINSAGKSLQIKSNDSKTVAIATNIGTDETAETLGLGGGKNVFTTLFKLSEALKKNDTAAILASLGTLDSSLESVNNSRAIIGASLSRVDNKGIVHEQEVVNQSAQLSKIEDADIVKSASDLANLEFALQATLGSTAQILQPTLLDFLR